MKWAHSIHEEPTFISEWQAVGQAHDHHMKVTGDLCFTQFGEKHCVDDVKFCSRWPGQSHERSHRVHFATHVEAIYGSGCSSSCVWQPLNESAFHSSHSDAPVEPLSLQAVLIPGSHVSDNPMVQKHTDAISNRDVEPLSFLPLLSPSLQQVETPIDAGNEMAEVSSTNSVRAAQDTGVPSDVRRSSLGYDLDDRWLLGLRSLWREHAALDEARQERILTICTWFLNHQTQPRCNRPRELQLDYMDHHWLNDIRDLWHDQILPGEALHITVLEPMPPNDDHSPVMAHVIISQQPVPNFVGIVMTARLIEEHRTQLIQVAVSSPSRMCATRAADLLQVTHLLSNRRWIARTGVLRFHQHELDDIVDGLSIIVDIRVPDAPPNDEVSFAAWTRHISAPQQRLADMHTAVQQEDHNWPDHDEHRDSEDDDVSVSSDHNRVAEDWRFCHLFLLGKQIFHGMIPWRNPQKVRSTASVLTGVPEDDIVLLHHVPHGPEDLQAARIEPIILQVFDDLANGSVQRLVLLDIEFHEHPPSTQVSTSRRCAALPHYLTRRTLLSFAGLGTYCERMKQRCLVWHNNEIVDLQDRRFLNAEHGSYVRIAIPPWPAAPPALSTRICASRVRQRPHRLSYDPPIRGPTEHEDGMTIIDSFIRDNRPVQHHDDDHEISDLLQRKAWIHERSSPRSCILASEIVVHFQPTVDAIDDEPRCSARHIDEVSHDHIRVYQLLRAQPVFVQQLRQLWMNKRQRLETHMRELVVETWYCDHQRRPHSGVGRVVHLSEDFTTWFATLVFTWDDWVDPFHDLSFHIVDDEPAGGDPEVIVHVILLQRADNQRSSGIVSITDTAHEPWHPRVMCLTVPRVVSHRDVEALVDIDHACSRPPASCHSWRHEQEVTLDPPFHVNHGFTMLFEIRHGHHPPVVYAPDPADDEEPDTTVLLQRPTKVSLQESLPLPTWVSIDCRKTLFLRNQLCLWELIQPCFTYHHVRWHEATYSALCNIFLCGSTRCPKDFHSTLMVLQIVQRTLLVRLLCLLLRQLMGQDGVDGLLPFALVQLLRQELKLPPFCLLFVGCASYCIRRSTNGHGSNLSLIASPSRESPTVSMELQQTLILASL